MAFLKSIDEKSERGSFQIPNICAMKKPTNTSPVTIGIKPKIPAFPNFRTSYCNNHVNCLLNGVERSTPMNSIIFAIKADFIPYKKIKDMIASIMLSSPYVCEP